MIDSHQCLYMQQHGEKLVAKFCSQLGDEKKRAKVVLFKSVPFVLDELFSFFVFFIFAPFSF